MNQEEQAVFFRQLATMIRAGMPILKSLESIRKNTSSRKAGRILDQMMIGIQRGENLLNIASSLGIFSPFIIGMLKGGEIAGQLDARTAEIAAFLENNIRLQRSMSAKLAYPLFVIHTSFILLPAYHIVSKSWASYFQGVFTAAIIFYAGIFLLWLLRYFLMKQESSAALWGRVIFSIPLIGSLLRLMALHRFLIVYGNLYGAGIPIRDAFGIAASSTGNAYVMQQINIALNKFESGTAPSDALAYAKILPDTIQTLLTAGEASGNIEEMAKKSASYLEMDIALAAERLATILPTLVLILLGCYIGYNVISIYWPYIKELQQVIK